MKKLVAILLFFVVTYGATYKALIIFHYQINNSEFVAKFCKNKENKQCQGKCHLKEVVSENENEQSSSFPDVSNLKELSNFIVVNYIFLFKNSNFMRELQYSYNIYFKLNDYKQKLLKPPTISYFI